MAHFEHLSEMKHLVRIEMAILRCTMEAIYS
jgi:hypothetical protein